MHIYVDDKDVLKTSVFGKVWEYLRFDILLVCHWYIIYLNLHSSDMFALINKVRHSSNILIRTESVDIQMQSTTFLNSLC